jgi:putative membrane protein
MAIFNEQEKQRIEARIAAAEQKTAAEIVVASVPASDGYVGVRWLFAVLVALCAGAVASLTLPFLRAGEVVAGELVIGALAYWLSGLPALLRRLTPNAIKGAAVERAAQLAFVQHTVFATRERTGVLILLSEQEHKVAILGDEGIHRRVQDVGWQGYVATIVQAIRTGKPGEGVCEVIDALAEVLAQGAPVAADDVNELPNRVRGE